MRRDKAYTRIVNHMVLIGSSRLLLATAYKFFFPTTYYVELYSVGGLSLVLSGAYLGEWCEHYGHQHISLAHHTQCLPL